MKYTTETIINLPIQKVIELFDNPSNLKQWMPNLQTFELISGIAGQPGAKSKLVFNNKGRIIEMIETITVRNLPHEFSGIYEAKGVYNAQVNKFIDLGNGTTRWISETEFQFSGFMKIIGFVMGVKAFKNETIKHAERFKAFAEKSVA